MARLSYADPADLAPEKRELLDTMLDADIDESEREHSLRGGSLNVYRAIARNPPLLEAFRAYASEVWAGAGLTPREREIVILSTAFYTDSSYEWHQHVRVALDEGIETNLILAISHENYEFLEPAHEALVRYVEHFVRGQVTDELHDRLAVHFDDDIILGVGMLAGCYLGLARVLQALGVELREEFVGWDLENL